MTLPPEQTIARESRWAQPAALAAFFAAALVLISLFVEGTGLIDGDTDAERLSSIHDHAGALLGVSIVRAIGMLLLPFPLLYLFRAAQARSDAVRGPLVGFAFVGPVLFAIQSIVGWAASTDLASQFVDGMPAAGQTAERFADQLIDDSSLRQAAAGMLLPALLGIVIGAVYIPLQALRTGLLTRFWATLGMALGASMIIVPLVPLIGLMMWFVHLGLVISDRWPGGRPPAWAAGRAIPWPKPGEEDGAKPPPESESEPPPERESPPEPGRQPPD
jgi:hypothetical protein